MAERFVMEEDCGGNAAFCESAGEYTLPDYMPEVRRVLRLDADATLSGQYESGDKTEVGGETRYCLLYTDTEGNIASANLDGNFEAVLATSAGTPLLVYPHVEGSSCRLGGPRRISLKAGVSLRPHAYRRIEVGEPQTADTVGQTELLRRPLHIASTEYFHASDIAVSESVKAEPGSEMLACGGKVLIREVRCENGGARIRGEVWLRALCNNESKTPYTVSTKIPLEEFVPCDGVTPEFTGIAWGDCHTLTAEVGEGENGTNLTFDTNVNLDGMAACNAWGQLASDMYATGYEMKLQKQTVTGRWYPVLQMANFTVDGSVPREDVGCEDTPRPVDCCGHATVGSCTADGSTVTVEGEIKMSCILACDREDGGYRAEGFPLPFKVRVNCAEPIPYGTALTCDVTCISCRARADANRLSVDAEIGICLMGCCYNTADLVIGAEPDPDSPVERAEDEVIAAYLREGDTLWSIGRRYHVPLSELVRANSLPDEVMEAPDLPHSLDGLTRLMIE